MAAWDVTTAAASMLFDTDVGLYSSCVQIDSNHFINFWRSESSDGYTQVFTVNTTTWVVTTAAAQLEYDTQLSQDMSAVKVDTNHFLNVWRGGAGVTGGAQIFTVNTTTWAVTTAAAKFTFDTQFSTYTSLVPIDSTHYLVVWRGGTATADSWAQVLTVNTTTWAVTTAAAKKQFDTDLGAYFECVKIDTNHFLNVWQGVSNDCYSQVFTVNTTTWAVTTAASSFVIDTNGGSHNACVQIDTNHFAVFRAGTSLHGFVDVLEVNTTTWAISTSTTSFEFDTQNGQFNSVVKIDTNHFINFWAGGPTVADGYVQAFTINTSTWAVSTAGAKLAFDADNTNYISAAQIDSNHFINFWYGGPATSDGYVQVFTVELPAAGTGPANLKSYNTNVKSNIKSINTNVLTNTKSLDTNV